MAESVLLTTHDLPLAGRLRAGFRRAGYRVELLAKGEDPSYVDDAALLVVTGGLVAATGDASDGLDSDASAQALRTVAEGRKMGVPVFVVGGRPGAPLPQGASAAFPLPADADEIVLVGRRAVERRRLREATGIVGETDAMVEVLERIVQIAPVDATVLVTGESGTGKELVARGLHALSRRRHKSFIPVNMAALTESLLESELFGHEKGAFTGAIDSRRGIFELADRGTVFLDEIGEMPLQTQTKLLRVLEQQEFLRVGGQKPIQVDVRILAATNQRLPERVAAGDFRKDLYYRLNVLHISMPPLRDRPEDIPLLVAAFVAEAGKRHDRGPFKGISEEAMSILVRHRWPGNVRELRNLVESMVVLAPGRRIRAEDIPADVRTGEGSTALVHAGSQVGRPAGAGAADMRPQFEFIFRTMMEMKVDIEDLRREFEAYRRAEEGGPPGGASAEIVYDPLPLPAEGSPASGLAVEEAPALEGLSPALPAEASGLAPEASAPPADPTTVLPADPTVALPPLAPASSDGEDWSSAGVATYRPGMTLDDMEREVLRTILRHVGGNRRMAAESLGIGERTLYRKIDRLGLEDDERPQD